MCGDHPDLASFGPCCVLILIVLGWALTALAASVRDGRTDLDSVFAITAVAGVLMAIAHYLPDGAAILLFIIMAVHTALIAIVAITRLVTEPLVRAKLRRGQARA